MMQINNDHPDFKSEKTNKEINSTKRENSNLIKNNKEKNKKLKNNLRKVL